MLNNIARIQRALTQAHLDAILLTDENDRRFATGFPSSDGAVIVTVHQAFFITDARYIEAARAALTGIAQVLLCSREAPMRTLVQGILREANVQILGGEEQTTSYAEFTAYEQLFGLKLQPAQNLIRNLRAAKQPEELAMMYQAQQITDETFAQICTVIRPGMTEREIAAELIYRMLRLGAEGMSFDPIVLTGPDTSMPHGVPGDRRVAAGDFVTMDFGCRKNGYCSDMTRTVAVGIPTDEMRSVYQTVLNAQLAGIAAAKAGVTGERVDAAARKVISDAGYGDYFGHSFGHSLGLDIHEHHHFENGFDDKLDYYTLEEAEKAAQGYVDGTMEDDGFKYDGAAVYDQQEHKCIRIYGDYPDEKAHAQVRASAEPEQQEPEHFIDHFYVAEDIQKRGALDIKEYSSFDDAL